jgi:hypothetical protein
MFFLFMFFCSTDVNKQNAHHVLHLISLQRLVTSTGSFNTIKGRDEPVVVAVNITAAAAEVTFSAHIYFMPLSQFIQFIYRGRYMKICVLYQRKQMGIKEKRRWPRKKGSGSGNSTTPTIKYCLLKHHKF